MDAMERVEDELAEVGLLERLGRLPRRREVLDRALEAVVGQEVSDEGSEHEADQPLGHGAAEVREVQLGDRFVHREASGRSQHLRPRHLTEDRLLPSRVLEVGDPGADLEGHDVALCRNRPARVPCAGGRCVQQAGCRRIQMPR